MNKQCTYCFQEAKYGVEPSEGSMFLYLCQLDMDIHKELEPEAKTWKLESPVDKDIRKAMQENAEDFAFCYARFGIPF